MQVEPTAPGDKQCSFNLSVGTQALTVLVRTYNNYLNNQSYVYPLNGTKISGIGDDARYTTTGSNGIATVKLGNNALEINVDFYTKPVDEPFVEGLARKATGRL
jgi:hypothetical protein